MAKRLKYLVIHCTATPDGKEVTSSDIRKWHTSPKPTGNGWKQVGYTDMIHLDGRVERLVQNNEDANVDNWEITNGVAGINSVSRHIVYVGGLLNYNWDILDPIIALLFGAFIIITGAGVPCSPINNVKDVIEDPQVNERNMIIETNDPIAGIIKMAGNPIKMSGFDDPKTRKCAPALDENRESILQFVENFGDTKTDSK